MAECRGLNETNIRAMNWIRVSAALGTFLVVGLMFTIVMIRKEFKTTIERLYIYLLLATLLREAIMISNIGHQFHYAYMDEVCSIIGALNHYSSHVVVIIVAATVVYLLARIIGWHQKSKGFAKHFEVGFIIVTFLLPLIISVGLLYTDIFGLSIAWCYMQEYDSKCEMKDSTKRIVGGYSIIFLAGLLNIFLAASMIIIYHKIIRKLKKATHLLKQPLILLLSLIVNLFILVVSSAIIITPIGQNYITLYSYTVVASLYDIIYPIGFLISLKYQTLASVVKTKRRRSSYIPIHKSKMTPSSPFSDRVSARSTTVAATAPYTGEFTVIESVH